MNEAALRSDARAIWDAAVTAANPHALVCAAVDPTLAVELAAAQRILVVGGGKAGSAMAAALEDVLAQHLAKVTGIVNVPAGSNVPTQRIVLHAARPLGSNQPTLAGVVGSQQMLDLVASATSEDTVVCLLSGGGSALLPAPAAGVSLEDKQIVTKQLHACGATIAEMNAVRKHLSRLKGGRLAQACQARRLVSLVISDVVGDPLDVIASGPTAPDSTTFADALAVLGRYELLQKVPASVRQHLEAGAAGTLHDTPKSLPASIENRIIGCNARALAAAKAVALSRGYQVLNLGAFVEGETRQVAIALAGVVRSIQEHGEPLQPPACLLIGGETTVTLGAESGKGGRNQEFVLAALAKLGPHGLRRTIILSGGTDGEDGPTDAAGAVAAESSWERAQSARLHIEAHLQRHNAYPFFDALGDLLRTGLTNTNVMDVRVILVG